MKKKLIEELLNLLYDELEPHKSKSSQISDKTNLVDEGILDSLSFLNYIVNIEERYKIELDFSELEPSEFTSIHGLVKIINTPTTNMV